MSQYDIIEYLKDRKNKWFTTTDIARVRDGSRSAITGMLRRMRKHDQVIYKEMHEGSVNIEYHYKYKPGTWSYDDRN